MNCFIQVVLAVLLLSPLRIFAQDFSKEEVAFKNGDYILNGTLVLPDTVKQNVPILIYMGGIEEWGDFHPSRQTFISETLENYFPRYGIGVFYYDPRGIGESSGRWHRATLPEFAEDAKAAVRFLKQRKEVDPSRIGIIGHGEDGWVAQIVAAENQVDVKIMISLAGPVFDAETMLINQYHHEYICDGQDSLRAYEKASQKAVSHQNWVSIFPLTKRWRHMKNKQGFDPTSKLRDISIPALFVFAENDSEVYPSWALEQLNGVFPGSLPSNFTVEVIPGANHFFKVTEPCYEEKDISVDKNFSFRFREVLRNWVFENL